MYHQPYISNLIDLLSILDERVSFDQVMVKRQRTAFPPNFVHSLDGSHMMMTAVACKKQGLYFAGRYSLYYLPEYLWDTWLRLCILLLAFMYI